MNELYILRYLTRLVGPVGAEDLSYEVFDRINRILGRFRYHRKLSPKSRAFPLVTTS